MYMCVLSLSLVCLYYDDVKSVWTLFLSCREILFRETGIYTT